MQQELLHGALSLFSDVVVKALVAVPTRSLLKKYTRSFGTRLGTDLTGGSWVILVVVMAWRSGLSGGI